MQEKNAVKGVKAEETLSEYDVEINQFKRNYPNGVPDQTTEAYDKSLAERDAHNNEAEMQKENFKN
jgi:hypothetical protein